MPITDGFVSRKMCVGPPKESFTEKSKKKKEKKTGYETVLKINPYRIKGGLHGGEFTTKARAGAPGGFDDKDKMRIANLMAKGAKSIQHTATMAKAITTWEKAHRRANAAQAAGQPEMAKIFRERADAIRHQTDAKVKMMQTAGSISQALAAGRTVPKSVYDPDKYPGEKKLVAAAGGGSKQTAAAHSQEAQYAASHAHGTSDGGTMHGGKKSIPFGAPGNLVPSVKQPTAAEEQARQASMAAANKVRQAAEQASIRAANLAASGKSPVITAEKAKAALAADAKSPGTPMHPSDKAKLEAIEKAMKHILRGGKVQLGGKIFG